MKSLKGRYYKEVKDKRYIIHPTEDFLLKLQEEQKSLRTQYQVQNETQIRKKIKKLLGTKKMIQ